MDKLQDFDKEFIMEMFLDNDSVNTMNRLTAAITDVIHENDENLATMGRLLKSEIVFPKAHNPNAFSLFYEEAVLNYTDIEYEEKFKMKRTTVQALILNLRQNVKVLGYVADFEKKLHYFLWILVNNCECKEAGKLFHFNKPAKYHSDIFNEIATLLADELKCFINWPSVEEQHTTRLRVHNRLKLPNCVGFIDACRLKTGAKKTKNKDTLLLQAVSDDSLYFLDVHVGTVGKTKKNKVYKESSLYKDLPNLVEFENHILGDSQYKLHINLITPFSNEELLTSEEMKFNETHWKASAYIGRAFELLKDKFRKLNHIDTVSVDTAVAVIKAACGLHNFILLKEGVPPYYESSIKEETICSEVGVCIDTSIVKNCFEKRQFLCNYLNYIDDV